MGDSEFVGGGSVKWKVRHSKGDNGNGNANGGNGKDKDPQGPNATFLVYADDHCVFSHPATSGHKVSVFWGPESTAMAQLAAVKSGAAKRKATPKKKYGKKKATT